MAKFLAGGVAAVISGSVSGTTYARNRYGAYMRNKAQPVNPSSTKQGIVRSRFGNLSQTWRGLTASQRLEWNTQAATLTLYDNLGQAYAPSGFQYFQAINSVRIACGTAQVTSPPAVLPSVVITAGGATAVGATGVVTVTFAPAIAANSFFILRATAPIGPGRSFIPRSWFKDLAYLATADTSPAVATATYAAVFGTPTTGDVGKVIHFQLIPVNASGVKGVPLQFRATIS